MNRNSSPKRIRSNRISYLASQLAELTDTDLPRAEGENSTDQLARIRRKREAISAELSALRLLQGEDRLESNLLIAVLSCIGLVLGALLGYLVKTST